MKITNIERMKCYCQEEILSADNDKKLVLLCDRLSQNFSFWESTLRFRGKSVLQAAFPKAFPKTNRVLGKAQVIGTILPDHRLPAVAEKCGFKLLTHHNALADAEACAVIAQKIL